MGINTRSATACALSLALLSLSAASGIGRTTGEASKAMTRRLLSGCLSYQSSFTNNCGNTHHACDINAECCCDGDTYTSLSGCNYCCNPGFVGCHVPTYDDYYQQTMDYGCYETACPAGSTQHVTTPNSSSGNSGGTQYGNGGGGSSGSSSSSSSGSNNPYVPTGDGTFVNSNTGAVIGGENPIADWG